MTDTRPTNCRDRLREEGKAYPKSACMACGVNIRTGLKCMHDVPMVTVDIESGDKVPAVIVDVAGAMDKMTPAMIEAMAPLLRDPLIQMQENQIVALQEALDRVRVAVGMEAGIAGAPGDIATEVEKRLNWPRFDGVPVNPETCLKDENGYYRVCYSKVHRYRENSDEWKRCHEAEKRGRKDMVADLQQGGLHQSCDFHTIEGRVLGRFHAFFPGENTVEDRISFYEDMHRFEKATKDATPLDFCDGSELRLSTGTPTGRKQSEPEMRHIRPGKTPPIKKGSS